MMITTGTDWLPEAQIRAKKRKTATKGAGNRYVSNLKLRRHTSTLHEVDLVRQTKLRNKLILK